MGASAIVVSAHPFLAMDLSAFFPPVHDTIVSVASGAGVALVSVILPYLNKAKEATSPQSRALAKILPLMDVLLMDKADVLKIGEVDLLEVAKTVVNRLADAEGFAQSELISLAQQAAKLWDFDTFKQRLEARGAI